MTVIEIVLTGYYLGLTYLLKYLECLLKLKFIKKS